MPQWPIFRGDQKQHDDILDLLPDPPPWRRFGSGEDAERERAKLRGDTFRATEKAKQMVSAALALRRPLLVTGRPGTGKSSLAWAVAHELGLGPVLTWPITTRATLQDGLYRYDAIARLQDASLIDRRHRLSKESVESRNSEMPSPGGSSSGEPPNSRSPVTTDDDAPYIGRYIQLGPLGTALLPRKRPRVLLIDEIDKSDIDLPNDLLHVFEEGAFEIPELSRLPEEPAYNLIEVRPHGDGESVIIERGRVRCDAFPFVVMTSNAEREFPPAFLRRCLRLEMPTPETEEDLTPIIEAHLTEKWVKAAGPLINEFLKRDPAKLATDQLLNAVWLLSQNINPMERAELLDAVLRTLTPHPEGETGT